MVAWYRVSGEQGLNKSDGVASHMFDRFKEFQRWWFGTGFLKNKDRSGKVTSRRGEHEESKRNANSDKRVRTF